MLKNPALKDESREPPEYLQGATNVYRTKFYIVKQIITVRYDSQSFNSLVSTDTFYLRTKSRDEEYERLLGFIKHRDGKRITTAMSTRRYIY